jgi:hypothetical protein
VAGWLGHQVGRDLVPCEVKQDWISKGRLPGLWPISNPKVWRPVAWIGKVCWGGHFSQNPRQQIDKALSLCLGLAHINLCLI